VARSHRTLFNFAAGPPTGSLSLTNAGEARAYWADSPRCQPTSARILHLIDGLKTVHSLGIVYRDLRADNLSSRRMANA
jgi:hypothetical protein